MVKIIEFFGPPGAGKTTLADHCVSYLKEENISVLNSKESQYHGYKTWLSKTKGRPVQSGTLELITRSLPRDWGEKTFDLTLFPGKHKYRNDLINQFVLQNPDLMNDLIDKINGLYENNEGKRILSWFQDAFFKYQNAIEYFDSEVVILDEAFCQQVLAAYSPLRSDRLGDDHEDDIIDLVTHISSNIDYAFFISAEPKTCLKRQEERRDIVQGFLKDVDEHRMKEYLDERLKYSQIIHETLLDNDVCSFKIDADKSLEESKDDLREKLDEMMPELI